MSISHDQLPVIPECFYRESNDFKTSRSPIKAFGDDESIDILSVNTLSVTVSVYE
jgi:hypothetical protein